MKTKRMAGSTYHVDIGGTTYCLSGYGRQWAITVPRDGDIWGTDVIALCDTKKECLQWLEDNWRVSL